MIEDPRNVAVMLELLVVITAVWLGMHVTVTPKKKWNGDFYLRLFFLALGFCIFASARLFGFK